MRLSMRMINVCFFVLRFVRVHHFDSSYLRAPDWVPEELKV